MSRRKKNKTCDGCLSTDRNLLPINEYYDIYMTLIADRKSDKSMVNIDVPIMCWECCANLRSIEKFREKVRKAQSYLSGKFKKVQKQISLSNLQATTNNFITEIKHEEDKMLIDIKVEELNTDDGDEKPNVLEFSVDSPDFKDDTCFDSDDKKNVEIDVKKEVKLAPEISNVKLENIKHERRKIKRKKYPPKYKLLKICDKMKPYYDKAVIDDTEREYWEDQDRNCRNYKVTLYKCEVCITGLKNAEAYMRHVKTFHSETSGEYMCDICKRQFKQKLHLQIHLKKHYTKFICKICKFECHAKLWKIKQHFEMTHRRAVECLTCGLHLPSKCIRIIVQQNRKDGAKSMDWTCQKSNTPNISSFTQNTKQKSPHCFSSTNNVGLQAFYRHHKELHRTFVCDFCGNKFNTKRRIANHIRLRHYDHSCKECNRTYSTIHALIRHNNMHHVKSASELCYCVECNIQFDNVAMYDNHLKHSVKHKKVITTPCPSCDKVYHKRHVMLNHYQHVHLKKTNHYCQPCDRYFLNGFRLRQHKASVHDKIPPVKNKICATCGRGFSTNRILENHIRTHTGERPFACTHCTSTFSQQQAMISHMRTIHKVIFVK